MNVIKLRDTSIQIVDGDRGENYPKKNQFSRDGYCIFLDASNVTKAGFNLNMPLFITKDKSDRLRKGKLMRDDIVVTTRGTIGNFAHFDESIPFENIRINSGMLIIRNSEEFDTNYLYSLFRSNFIAKQLSNMTTGSSQPQITAGIVNDLTLIKPDLPTQRSIARTISLLSSKIALGNRVNAKLEEVARAIYNFWFIQFEFPDANNRPFKTAGGEMVYSEELKRKIPVGWRVENLHKNSLTEIIKPKIDIFTDYKMYLDTSTVSGLAIELGEKILYCSRTSRANMQPIANSVWFAKMQSSIKHIIVGEWSRDLIDNTVLSTGFMGLSVKRHALGYVAGYIRNPYFEIVKDSNSHGATMSGIGNDDLKNIKIVVPLENVLRNFNKSTTMLWQQIDRNRQENQRLIELRDWLSPMLVNGQIEVS